MVKPISDFIKKWSGTGAHERANYQGFLNELCDLLGTAKPDPAQADLGKNDYVFERYVKFEDADGTTTWGWIDLYKRDCFALEAKQGSDKPENDPHGIRKKRKLKQGMATRGTPAWAKAMLEAKGQAEQYAKWLPADHGWPPFIVVVDVGHCIELYADFSGTGKNYVQFPDRERFRILLDDLADEAVRDRLAKVWTEPQSLDPAAQTARVTREIADRLARLAKSLEGAGHAPEKVAGFLMRCLFCMFAEDVDLLPRDGFTALLNRYRDNLKNLPFALDHLWRVMNKGGFSPSMEDNLKRFNGGLFRETHALPLDQDQLDLMIEAAEADWTDVEPAIFGTLLERALDPKERHKLGAHYTPRAYVDRLVMPTIIEPLREDWSAAKAAALLLAEAGDEAGARREVRDFHRRLCEVKVLDPACGSGNFLYASLEHMKRLEGEVLDTLSELGEKETYFETLEGHTVDPHQFLGIEINPRAAWIAEMVLWIGYLQWHFRTRGKAEPAEPILRDFKNIECREAILAYDKKVLRRDDDGNRVTRWDGETMKPHPVTGKDVPDETAQVEVWDYTNPRPASWPEADFIVGNPPFVGKGSFLREALGDGYFEALLFLKAVPASADFVMYWWEKAANLVAIGGARRFGLITTNSLPQSFSRRVVAKHLNAKKPVSLAFAVPDHPWVDESGSAAVRIAMTVARAGKRPGKLMQVSDESGAPETIRFTPQEGMIHENLRVGADVASAKALLANGQISSNGMMLAGAGFLLAADDARKLADTIGPKANNHIKPYRNGRDLVGITRNLFVIDMFGLSENELRTKFPEIYQLLHSTVRPHREQNRRQSFRNRWWVFGEPRKLWRRASNSLGRYIATTETSKHRMFQFLPSEILPDHMLIAIALEDALHLAALSSRIHVVWALAAGGRLGVGNDPRYNKSRCFDPFPFPDPSDDVEERLRHLGEQLDAHRKERQAAHPELTMTGMYNVLEKLRAGEALTDKEKDIHDKGLVSVLKQIHDDIDAATFEAYGWPKDLTDEQILERLVALNKERVAEEKRDVIRWLRPEFQAPDYVPPAEQLGLDVAGEEPEELAKPSVWPKGLPDQVQAVRERLEATGSPLSVEQVAKGFARAKRARVREVLATLVALGQARALNGDRYAA